MDVYWLQQNEAEVPGQNDWLSAAERTFLEGLRFEQRRASRRFGRWTAKRALATCWQMPNFPPAFADIEVRPEPSGAPAVFFKNEPVPISISLSHRGGKALCTVGPPAVRLGCDLECIEPHSDPFIADYFVAEEQALVAQADPADRPRILALLWSAKESALKALHEGLRLDTRSVIVTLPDVAAEGWDWTPMSVRHTDGQIFNGWWQIEDRLVRTVVADPSPAAPISLNSGAGVPRSAFVIPPFVFRSASNAGSPGIRERSMEVNIGLKPAGQL